jgi:hypothetical protein
MSSAARSILVYSIYVFGLGATLLLAPNIPLPREERDRFHGFFLRSKQAGMRGIARHSYNGSGERE